NLIALIFGISAVSTWGFWRWRRVVTLEALLLVSAAVYLLSGHRNYHFDVPQIVSSLAWHAHVEHLTMLLILGSVLTLLTIVYLYVASRPALRTLTMPARKEEPATLERGRSRLVA